MPIVERQSDRQLAERAQVLSPVCSPVAITTVKNIVSLTTATPNATIYYSIDGGKEQIYTAPFSLIDGGVVRAYATAQRCTPSALSEENIGAYISKQGWSIVSFSSQQNGGAEVARNVIDENPNTIWHTQYAPETPSCPHEVVVDMGKSHRVAHFVYQGRQDMTNGRVNEYEFYVSDNVNNWGEPVCKGRLENSSSTQEVALNIPKTGRYFRFVALSTHDRRQYVSSAELGIVPVIESKQKLGKRIR